VDDPVTSHDVNVNGTLCVLERARSLSIKRVVFAASSSAYGDQRESPKHEGMVLRPQSIETRSLSLFLFATFSFCEFQ
jgi:UDP-glucose 4-epimerase